MSNIIETFQCWLSFSCDEIWLFYCTISDENPWSHVNADSSPHSLLIPNCTSGKDVYILPLIPLTEGVGQLGL